MKHETLVASDELARHLGDPAWVVVDCRHNLAAANAGELAYRAAHIPGALFMNMERDLTGPKTGRNGRHPLPDADALAATFGAFGIDAGKQVVAYDQNAGMWASRLWWSLRWLGHSAVAVLDGGMDKWLAEGLPTTTNAPTPKPSRFVPSRPAGTASADEIVRHLDDGTLLVLDARAPERYRGDLEPIDPIAGHIPGARNRPYTENLAGAQLKPAGLLRSEFEALLGGRPPASVVHQCGSGVTACHNALAMAIADLPGSRLYPGSWSEWIADPRRPIARG